jgi:hypothetical protein
MSDRAPALEFSRFEFKYRLDQRCRELVEGELRHFAELDPWVASRPDQQYFVRSLYFDDPAFSAFHAKDGGALRRARFRVRTYSRSVEAGAPWFLETKGRNANVVIKHRTPLQGEFDPHVAGDGLSRALLQHAIGGRVRDRFEFEVFRRRIRPCVLVDYVRRPYSTRFDPDFRVTFDSEIAGIATDTMFPEPRLAPRALLRGFTVMEVKFRRTVPAWFHRILQVFELRRDAISKVAIATQALGLQSAAN